MDHTQYHYNISDRESPSPVLQLLPVSRIANTQSNGIYFGDGNRGDNLVSQAFPVARVPGREPNGFHFGIFGRESPLPIPQSFSTSRISNRESNGIYFGHGNRENSPVPRSSGSSPSPIMQPIRHRFATLSRDSRPPETVSSSTAPEMQLTQNHLEIFNRENSSAPRTFPITPTSNSNRYLIDTSSRDSQDPQSISTSPTPTVQLTQSYAETSDRENSPAPSIEPTQYHFDPDIRAKYAAIASITRSFYTNGRVDRSKTNNILVWPNLPDVTTIETVARESLRLQTSIVNLDLLSDVLIVGWKEEDVESTTQKIIYWRDELLRNYRQHVQSGKLQEDFPIPASDPTSDAPSSSSSGISVVEILQSDDELGIRHIQMWIRTLRRNADRRAVSTRRDRRVEYDEGRRSQWVGEIGVDDADEDLDPPPSYEQAMEGRTRPF